jgi:hypothetical protein
MAPSRRQRVRSPAAVDYHGVVTLASGSLLTELMH